MVYHGEADDGQYKLCTIVGLIDDARGDCCSICVDKMFHFTCFNVEDPDDPAVGLVNGEVTIPGNLLRREVFDPVVDEVSLASLFAGLAPSGSHR